MLSGHFYILVLVCSLVFNIQCSKVLLTEQNASNSSGNGCPVGEGFDVMYCNEHVDYNLYGIIPYGNTCVVTDEEDTSMEITCLRQEHHLIYTRVQPEVRHKRQDSTIAGAAAGSVFGPVGTVVGGLIGSILDICIFFCHSSKPSPPPNHPPQVTRQPTLRSGTVVIAGPGQTQAKVSWTNPVIHDKEDGNLNIVTSPSNFHSGGSFGQGHYTVFFSATDKKGLPAQASLSFEVQVKRCGAIPWPDHGDMSCTLKSRIFGTKCTVTCDKGYEVSRTNTPIECGQSETWSQKPRDCNPVQCNPAPSINHGQIKCLHGRMVYNAVCEIVCSVGYAIQGQSLVSCNENGIWDQMPVCQDVEPPEFIGHDCPNDITVNIDDVDNKANVTWDIPRGKDNSNDTVIITESHGYTPGQRFDVGSHSVKYAIKDKSQNEGDSCNFAINVQSVSCSPPDLNVPGSDHLLYNCPNVYTLGAKCDLSCSGGYPFAGSNTIQCTLNNTLDWRWDNTGLKPFCKETNCTKLHDPLNGAMACSLWTHGQMCQMQCEKGYDIPNIGYGQFVCGKSTGQWRPTDNVPDCNAKMIPNHMYLPSEFYYFTGKCNNSAQNLQQIQNNFVQALNASKFHEYCVGVPDCQSRFVGVSCGLTSKRRRRDTRYAKRPASSIAYIITFELILPYKESPGKSTDDVFRENENLLYQISDKIQVDADAGRFNIQGLTVDTDSFAVGNAQYKCPLGMMPRQATASCVGCPVGQYLSDETGKCAPCGYGSYQDSPNSISCTACPPNANTTSTGSKNKTMCREYCQPGHFSPTGLSPCAECPANSFQDSVLSLNCKKCQQGTKTITTGATSTLDCKAFDVQISKYAFVRLDNNVSAAAITISFWVYIRDQSTNPVIQIMNSVSSVNLTISLASNIVISANSKTVKTANGTLMEATWTPIAIVLDNKAATIYIDGLEPLSNGVLAFSRGIVLENTDVLVLKGDMIVSAFHIIGRKALPTEIENWAKTCSPSIANALHNTDELSMMTGTKTIIPSVCDAINACKSSPCGTYECFDKPVGYKCRCKDGYTGKQCEIPPDFCASNSCQNGASCLNGKSNYTCECLKGYRGDVCETKAIDGKWSALSNWTACSVSCGGGIMTRTRHCDSPPPDPDGVPCQGQDTETNKCAEDKCPECSRLRRSLGVNIHCNMTQYNQRCTIACRPGLYFANPPLPVYECGLATNYKWNHQDESNPNGRLPSCSAVKPPSHMGVEFDGNYDSVPCTDKNQNTISSTMEDKLNQLECVKDSSCVASIKANECKTSRRKRQTASGIRTTIEIKCDVTGTGSGINVAEVMQNNTAPSSDLINLVKLTMELEKAAQKIANGSMSFFQVTIDGQNHSIAPGPSGISFKPTVHCPSGSIRLDVFCAECPVGSYSDGETVTMCPRGQYQDEKGQATCKSCPLGKTTVGIGSIHVLECSVNVNDVLGGGNDREESFKDDVSKAVPIAVGISVSSTLLVLASLAMVLTYKHYTKKPQFNDSFLNLNTVYSMPTKPVFHKSEM